MTEVFGRPFVKRFALCYRSVVCPVCPVLSVLSVTFVHCGWTDQDETWHAGRPRPSPHCVRWGPSSPPQFLAHICCGQMAGWIKMPLGMELGLGPGDFVLDGTQPFSPKRGRAAFPIFGPCPLWPNGWVDQTSTWHGGGPCSRPHCAAWGPSSLPKKGGALSPNFCPFPLCDCHGSHI